MPYVERGRKVVEVGREEVLWCGVEAGQLVEAKEVEQ